MRQPGMTPGHDDNLARPAQVANGATGGWCQISLDDTLPTEGPDQEFGPLERAGDTIARYRLAEVLGEGGFGTVWRAEQTQPIHREVALKVIKPGMDSMAIVARFLAERQMLVLMDHPNIAKVLDAGATEGGRPFFVMELVAGVPLTQYADEHELSLRERLELFLPVCHAVQHAHQKAVLHRDLKPSNILVAEVDGRPVPKVIDFGIAKALAGDDATGQVSLLRTRQDMVLGTPPYMSPEQAGRSGQDVDTRSDLYALGAILYELLTGVTPLGEEMAASQGAEDLLRQIREVEPKRPSSRWTTVTSVSQLAAHHRHAAPYQLSQALRGDLDWIVLKALEKDRERRYQTADALAEDVEHYLRDEPVSASSPSQGYRLRKLIRRNKGLFASIGAIILCLLGGIGLSTYAFLREAAQRRQALVEGDKARLSAAFAQQMVADSARYSHEYNNKVVTRATLDQAAGRLRQEFNDYPEVRLQLYQTVVRNYMFIQDHDRALRLAPEAIALSRTVHGGRDEVTASLLTELAGCQREKGLLAEAAQSYDEALGILRSLGLDHADHAPYRHLLRQRALNLGKLKRWDEAAAQLRLAVAFQEQADGGDVASLVNARRELHYILAAAERWEEAAENLAAARRAVECVQGRGINLFQRTDLEFSSAEVLLARGDTTGYLRQSDDGLRLLREANELFLLQEKLTGGARHLLRAGLVTEAGLRLEEARRMLLTHFLHDRKTTATRAGELAGLFHSARRYEEALALHDVALTAGDETSPGDWSHLLGRLHRMSCLRALHRFAEAEQEGLQIWAQMENGETPGAPPSLRRRTATELASLYQTWNEAEPAQERQEAWETWRRHHLSMAENTD